jgi:hypothetical protein
MVDEQAEALISGEETQRKYLETFGIPDSIKDNLAVIGQSAVFRKMLKSMYTQFEPQVFANIDTNPPALGEPAPPVEGGEPVQGIIPLQMFTFVNEFMRTMDKGMLDDLDGLAELIRPKN